MNNFVINFSSWHRILDKRLSLKPPFNKKKKIQRLKLNKSIFRYCILSKYFANQFIKKFEMDESVFFIFYVDNVNVKLR